MPTVYIHDRHAIATADQLAIDDSVMVPGSDGWDVHVTRLDGVRDEAGRAPYRLDISNHAGKVLYSSNALYLHDWHDPIEAAAGWASSILDPGSGYSDDDDADESIRVRRIRDAVPPGVADSFAIVAMEREESD